MESFKQFSGMFASCFHIRLQTILLSDTCLLNYCFSEGKNEIYILTHQHCFV